MPVNDSLPARPSAAVPAAAVPARPWGPARLARRLRGRGRWLALGAAAGAALGGGAGWFTGDSLYRSTLVVSVDPSLPDIRNAAERATSAAMVREHLERQAELLRSPAVREAAGAGVLDGARASVGVAEHAARGLEMGVVADSPAAAEAALARWAKAYRDAYRDARATLDRQLAALANERSEAAATLAALHRKIAQEAGAFGPLPLEQVAASRAEEVRRVDRLLSETDLAMAAAVAPAGAGEPGEVGVPGANGLGGDADVSLAAVQTLARSDRGLRELLKEREAAAGELASLRRRMGPNARAVLDAVATLERVDGRIRERLASASAAPVEAVGGAPSADATPTILLTEAQLRQRREGLVRLKERLTSELTEIAERQRHVRALSEEAEAAAAKLDAVTNALDRLRLQRDIAGTLSLSGPATPVSPYRDTHTLHAAAGSGVGLTLGLLAVLLGVAADNRLRRPDSMSIGDEAAPLFGAVPTVDPDALGGDAADVTALAIHEIRALMQIRAQSHGARAFAVTSPGRGAGKTSLTVGLASSLALSGTRTLLVDCDLAGRADAAPRAARPGDVPPDQKQHLDAVMLQMGYLDTSDPEVLLLSHDAKVGITGLLEGGALEHCVIETSVPGLSVLPALSANSGHIARMSTAFVRRLISEAKAQYDMIIFDTGPVPGSVEALVVTSEADATILVVPRGELRKRFDQAVSYLRVVGAQLVGTVFNRAAAEDLTVQTPQRSATAGSAPRRSTPTRVTGSGLLAAAVHTQSNEGIGEGRATAPRAETEKRRTPPKGRADDAPLSMADAGDITRVLRDDPPPPPPPSPGTGAPRRKPRDILEPMIDDDLEDALDRLVQDARSKPPGAQPDAARPSGIRPPRRAAGG